MEKIILIPPEKLEELATKGKTATMLKCGIRPPYRGVEVGKIIPLTMFTDGRFGYVNHMEKLSDGSIKYEAFPPDQFKEEIERHLRMGGEIITPTRKAAYYVWGLKHPRQIVMNEVAARRTEDYRGLS